MMIAASVEEIYCSAQVTAPTPIVRIRNPDIAFLFQASAENNSRYKKSEA